MKLYSVSARWHVKRQRGDVVQTAVIMADSREEAVEKFKNNVSYPEDAYISATEHKDGIYTLGVRKTF